MYVILYQIKLFNHHLNNTIGSFSFFCSGSRVKNTAEYKMMPGNGQLTVPPGFRFHPTDEELLYYYLRKKVSYEVIDLDVIREVDLNKLEPWDLNGTQHIHNKRDI